MGFQHYLQLARYYRRALLRIAIGTTLLAAVASLYWLLSSPVYTATTKVVMLPSDAELVFTDVWLRGSDMSPATIMTETHIEYLLSRPVIERTLDKINAQHELGGNGLSLDGEGQDQTFGARLSQLSGQAKEGLRSIYHVLNYGEFVPLSTRQIAIDQLRRGIEIRAVEGSYLLEISVSHNSREAAAMAANALAEAYIERAAVQAKESAEKLVAFLQAQIEQREQQISDLIEREYALRESEGIVTLEEARTMLMSMQETQREKELDNQARLTELEVKLRALKQTQRGVKSQRIQATIEEAITLGEAEKQGIARSQPLRLQFIDEIIKEVNALGAKERPLVVLQRQRERFEADITDLQKRLVIADLGASNAISKMRVVESAVPPRYPNSPKVVVNTSTGLIAGLLLGLFLLIALDTFSSKVITRADVRRLTGERFIGGVTRRKPMFQETQAHTQSLSSAAVEDNAFTNNDGPARKARPRGWSALRAWLLPATQRDGFESAAGLAMERQLTILGAFETTGLLITGFCDQNTLQQAAEQITTVLKAAGVKFEDTSSRGDSAPNADSAVNGDTMSAEGESRDADKWVSQRPSIQVIKPVSATLRWQALALRKATLVCVIPAGEINERTLYAFQRKAIHSGVSSLAFVLLEQ